MTYRPGRQSSRAGRVTGWGSWGQESWLFLGLDGLQGSWQFLCWKRSRHSCQGRVWGTRDSSEGLPEVGEGTVPVSC